MAKTIQIKVDIEKIREIPKVATVEYDVRPVIAKTMRACGCTFDEIGLALGISRPLAKYYTDK